MSSGYASEIKSYYSEWWENPKDIRNVIFDDLNETVRVRIPLGNGKKALDIGSGHGRIVSYLLEKGYEVTAVEFNEQFVAELSSKFSFVRVIAEDVRDIELDREFDICTCIELLPMLNEEEQLALLTKLATVTKLLLVNVSNRYSLHSRWVEVRGWRNPFIINQTPGEFEQILKQAGFHIIHSQGIGLVTPVSLFKNFKGKLIPVRLAKAVNRLDPLAPKLCHLYYVEATSEIY